MRSLLMDLSSAFSHIHSGWILWNLFLAFVPLALSFMLFRRETITQRWLWFAWGVIGFVGVVGFLPRAHYFIPDWVRLMQGLMTGDRSALLKIFWLVAVVIASFGLSIWLSKGKQGAQTWLWWVGFVTFLAFLPNAPYLLTDIIHLIRGTSSGQIPIWVVMLVFIPIHITAILLGFEAYVVSLINQGYYLKKQGFQALIMPAELVIHALSAVGIYLGRFIRFNSWDLVTEPNSVLMTTLNALTDKRPMAVIGITFLILTIFYWIMKQVTLGLKLRIQYARMGLDVLD